MTIEQTKDWGIRPKEKRVTLDDQRRAETKFAVQNLGDEPQSATVAIITDVTAAGWFTISQPTRTIEPRGETTFAVVISVPPEVPPGDYAFQASAYRSDSASEENASISPAVTLAIPAGTQPQPRRRLWLLAIPAALVVVAAAVTAVVLATRPDSQRAEPAPTTQPVPTPSAGPTQPTEPAESTSPPPTRVAVPDVTGLREAAAIATLTEAGLVPLVRHRHDPSNAGRITQDTNPGIVVAIGTTIELESTVWLNAPDVTSPVNVATAIDPSLPAPPGHVASNVWFHWTQKEPYVTKWEITYLHQVCQWRSGSPDPYVPWALLPIESEIVTTTSFTEVRYWRLATTQDPANSAAFPASCGKEHVMIAAIDDFGNRGPQSFGRYHVSVCTTSIMCRL